MTIIIIIIIIIDIIIIIIIIGISVIIMAIIMITIIIIIHELCHNSESVMHMLLDIERLRCECTRYHILETYVEQNRQIASSLSMVVCFSRLRDRT